jgi:hexokinase
LLDRSADLTATAIAGLIKTYSTTQQQVGILAEGTTFWRTPGYHERVENTLVCLVERA